MTVMNQEIIALLESLKARGRSSPTGIYWHQYWESLRSRKSQKDSDPPVALILAASGESAWIKQERLGAQLEWAHKIGCLAEAVAELDAIPENGWDSCATEQWHKDSYPRHHYGWTSDPKAKISDESAAKLIEHLRASWPEIAGPMLSGCTSPLRFSGDKGCRLVVFARLDVSPPWGTWSSLDQGDNRKHFTRLRAAVNATVHPFEVDHIDFVHESADEVH